MSTKKDSTDKRSKKDYNERYAWTDDSVPLLDINSQNIKSTPKKIK